MLKKICAAAAALLWLSAASTLAHADEWKGVPHPLFFPNGTTVTPEMINEYDTVTLPHCLKVAYETIPGRDRAILGHAFTTGLAGGAGEGAGYAGYAATTGAKVALGPLTLLGFLSNVFFGGLQGNTLTNERFRSATDGCLARAGGGLYTMAPSEAKEILQSGMPREVGLSKYWHVPGKAPEGPPKVLPGVYVNPSQN